MTSRSSRVGPAALPFQSLTTARTSSSPNSCAARGSRRGPQLRPLAPQVADCAPWATSTAPTVYGDHAFGGRSLIVAGAAHPPHPTPCSGWRLGATVGLETSHRRFRCVFLGLDDGLLVNGQRSELGEPRLWASPHFALVGVAPNVIWQATICGRRPRWTPTCTHAFGSSTAISSTPITTALRCAMWRTDGRTVGERGRSWSDRIRSSCLPGVRRRGCFDASMARALRRRVAKSPIVSARATLFGFYPVLAQRRSSPRASRTARRGFCRAPPRQRSSAASSWRSASRGSSRHRRPSLNARFAASSALWRVPVLPPSEPRAARGPQHASTTTPRRARSALAHDCSCVRWTTDVWRSLPDAPTSAVRAAVLTPNYGEAGDTGRRHSRASACDRLAGVMTGVTTTTTEAPISVCRESCRPISRGRAAFQRAEPERSGYSELMEAAAGIEPASRVLQTLA